MKNKNIVRDKNKKTPFYKDKKGILAVILILLMFLLTAMTMPMSEIPLLGRMAHIFGLTDESMRNLTLSDFAAYTFGVEGGGRLASVRNGQYSVYESSGGLSPFGSQSSDRLLDAKQAYLKEFEKTGRWNASIAGSASGYDIDDPEGIGVSAGYGRAGAVAPTIGGAEGADNYGQPFVKPFSDVALDDAYAAGNITKTDSSGRLILSGSDRSKFIKPSGEQGKIRSARSDENFMYFQALDNKAKKLKGGRLGAFGGINAITSRVRTNIGGSGQLNVFRNSGKDMGRVYYLSRMATSQKYNDVSKNLVEAAWDGGEVESEDLIAEGEETEKVLNSLDAPSNIINKAGGAINACSAAKKAHKAKMESFGQSFKEMKKQLFEEASYDGNPPGSCRKLLHPRVYAKRQAWNGIVDGMIQQCESMRDNADQYAGKCGLNYDRNVSCSTLNGLKLKQGGGFSYFALWKWIRRCKREVITEGYGTLSPSDAKQKSENVIKDVVKGAGLDGTVNENFF